jgi:hypothetical protein
MSVSTEILLSSPVFVNSIRADNSIDSSMSTTSSYIKNKCESYHTHLDTVHAKIYRYNSFLDLLSYLENTVLIHFPYIDYPSDEILKMILTGTQLNHVEENTSEQLLNFSIPCIQYINSLLKIFDKNSLNFVNSDQEAIFNKEIDNLYEALKKMFSFLKPVITRRVRPKRSQSHNTVETLPIDEATLEYSIDEVTEVDENELRNQKIESVFEISTTADKFNKADTFFGVKYLSETEQDLWVYVQFALKIASKLSEVERIDSYESYTETWTRWREFLNILIKFFALELKINEDISYTLLAVNILKYSKCTEPNQITQATYSDSLLAIVKYIFTDSTSNFNKSSILSTDLCLGQKYIFSCNSFMFEYKYHGSTIGLNSIPVRNSLLRICWGYILKLPIDELVRSKYIDTVAKELVKLRPRELLGFFSDPALFESDSTIDDLFFLVSFEIMRLMSRGWNITPARASISDNHSEYLNRLKELFDYLTKNSKYSTSKYSCDLTELTESYDYGTEKCFILAKYQLLRLSKFFKFSEVEWNLLDQITFFINNNLVSLGKIIKKELVL